MYLLTVELKDFSAAHRLIKGYRGKCQHLHGHNYSLRIVIAADEVGNDGLVADFSVARALSNEWVQAALDHCTLVCQDDQPLLNFLQHEKQKLYVLSTNTTVECVAREIYNHLQPIFSNESTRHQLAFHLQQVEVWESATCGVIYCENQTKTQGIVCGQQ